VDVRAWAVEYGRAWQEADVDGFVALFADDAVYRSSPFREPFVGSAAIRAYVERATGSQSERDVRIGEPVVEGDRAAVEWWATMRDDGEEITLPGTLILRFGDDGRCTELREYWHVEPGRRAPHEGWGR
jgi:ketosteroid isomerase-like protein